MSLSAAAIRLLANKGLSADDIADVAEANAMQKSSAAIRQQRYRDRNKRDVTRDVTQPLKEETSNPGDNPSAKADCPKLDERIVLAWNDGPAKAGATKALPLNASRKRHLAARVRENGEEAVFRAIRNIAGSEWHTGRGSKGWRADIGWILKSPENFQKAMELAPPPLVAKQVVPVEQTIRARQDQARIYRRMGRESEADELDRETERIRKAAGIGEILHRLTPPNPTPQAEGMR